MPMNRVRVCDLIDAALRVACWSVPSSTTWVSSACSENWTVCEDDAEAMRAWLAPDMTRILRHPAMQALNLGARRSQGRLTLVMSVRAGLSLRLPKLAHPWNNRVRHAPEAVIMVSRRSRFCPVQGSATELRGAMSVGCAHPERHFVAGRAARAIGYRAYPSPRAAAIPLLAADAGLSVGDTELRWPLSATDLSAAVQAHAEQRKLRILVAEDSAPNRLLLQLQLQKQGHEVHCVEHGAAAVAAAGSEAFDLVLMDISMPKMDGLEALRRIRENGGTGLPVLALTGRGTPDELAEIDRAGFDGCLHKPVGAEALVGALRPYAERVGLAA